MPRHFHPNPYDQLVVRAAHDPALAARLEAAQREEPAPKPSYPGPRRFPTPIYPARIVAPIEAGEPPSVATVAREQAADATPVSDPAWAKAPPTRGTHGGGHPRKVAPWFEDVARAMADGTCLRTALVRSKVHLREDEIQNMYKLRGFRAIYQRERRAWLKQWGRKRTRGPLGNFMRGPREPDTSQPPPATVTRQSNCVEPIEGS